jgi:uncharacterized membrane protein (UPF0182 family)
MSRRYPPNIFDQFGGRGPTPPPIGDIRIPRPPRRFWIGLGFIAAAILIFIVAAPIVTAITDYQWFDALGYGSVFGTRLLLETSLFIVSLLFAFGFVLGNVMLAIRSRAGVVLRRVGIKGPSLRRGPGLVGLLAAAFLALVMGLAMRGSWESLVLYRQASPTGVRDPVFNLDVSFYLLQLPLLQTIQGWLLALVLVTGLIVLGLYAWRGTHFDFHLAPRAIAHLSALLAGMALVIAFGTWLDRFSFLYNQNSFVSGAGYADIHARIPLTNLRTGLAVLLALALLANLRLRLLRVIFACVGVWIVAAIIAGIYPALVQRISVQPNELVQEQPYIAREIAFTRAAYGLSHVQTSNFGGDQPVTPADVRSDQATINNLRLWDQQPLKDTYTQLQSIRTYYTFNNVDIDRYTINGDYQQVEISAREMDQSKLQAQGQSWVNQKLQYTHGYGAAASPVATVVGEGLPQFVVQDIPPTGPLSIRQPQLYFGQLESDYVLAPSNQPEFDYPQGSGNAHNQWSGTNAPAMTGFNRVLWSMRTGDFNLLVSSEVQDHTRILYMRNVQDRVRMLAPFLSLRDDPYLVIVNGKLYWIQDALITAGTHPYSQTEQSGDGSFNYLRNSVKVVVDAYSGSTDLYIADPTDPIIRAYQGAFPALFKPIAQMPSGLRAHLRVPQSQFNIQADIYRLYHVSVPGTLYNREDVWSMPLTPYYVLMRLPGQSKAEYLMILPYTPLNKQNLVSWLAVRQDAPHYGEMVSFVLPKDKAIFGPQQVSSRVDQTPTISRDYTLLNQSGSQVIRGNLLVVPIGNSFLYFEPWYLKATNQQSLPELKKVILASSTGQSTVAYQNNLEAALTELVGGFPAPAPSGAGPGAQPPPQSGQAAQIAQLAAQAKQHYDNAQAALKQGDLATYSQEMNQVGQLLQQIDALEKGQAGSTTSTPAPLPSR